MMMIFTRFIILLIIVIAWSNTVYAQTLNVPSSVVQDSSSHGGGGSSSTIEKHIDLDTWSGQQALTVTSTFTDGTARGGSACDGDGEVDYINTTDSSVINSMTEARISVSICLNLIDKLDRSYTMTMTADQAAFDDNAAHCSSKTVCTVTITILDTNATTVRIDTKFKSLTEGEIFGIPFTLSRQLIAGEQIDVPWELNPNGTVDDSDYQLMLKSAPNLNRGVTFDSTTLSFKEGAKGATLQVKAIHDQMRSEGTEFLLLRFLKPVNFRGFREPPTLANRNATEESVSITITNDSDPPPAIRIRSKVFLEGALQ